MISEFSGGKDGLTKNGVCREGRTDSSVVLKSGSVLKMIKQGRQRLIELGC
jgi:hypothetical protein